MLIRHGCQILGGSAKADRVETSDECVKSCREATWCVLAQFDHLGGICELFRSPRSFYPLMLKELPTTSIYEIYCKGENLVNIRILLQGSEI